MAISEAYSLNGVTVGTTELSIVSGTTTLQSVTDDGMYQLFLECPALAKGDEFLIQIKEKVLSGGTQRTIMQFYTPRVPLSEPIVVPPLLLLHGWDMTITKIAGTDRAWTASIRKVA